MTKSHTNYMIPQITCCRVAARQAWLKRTTVATILGASREALNQLLKQVGDSQGSLQWKGFASRSPRTFLMNRWWKTSHLAWLSNILALRLQKCHWWLVPNLRGYFQTIQGDLGRWKFQACSGQERGNPLAGPWEGWTTSWSTCLCRIVRIWVWRICPQLWF